MRLSSINGEPCRDLPFERIMAQLRDLSPSAPIQLEMEATSAARSGASEEVSKPEPMSLSVNCAPESKGGECNVVSEVQLTLEPSAARAVTWKRGRSIEGRPVVLVDRVAEESEAFRSGMRPGMMVKRLIGGPSGWCQEEGCKMDKLRMINMRNFEDGIRLAQDPITFVMLEGVKLDSESTKWRNARAHERRKQIEDILVPRIGRGRRDLPRVSVLICAIFLPASVILALSSIFGWFADMSPH